MNERTESRLTSFFRIVIIAGITAFIVARIYSPYISKAKKYDAITSDLNTIIEEYEGAVEKLKEIDTEDDDLYELMTFVVLDMKNLVSNNK